MLAVTDPERTPDVLALARSLPGGAGIILRTFGRLEIEAAADALSDICRRRGLTLLVAADPSLARSCGAAGVHWPERLLARAHRPWRDAIVTAAAHSPRAMRRASQVADAILLSPVFVSASPSAGRPLGLFRAAAFARRSERAIYALGGVNASTAGRLLGLDFAGFAAVAGLTPALSVRT